jgi:23S rRNA pseudouridine1911/1915/1917 synthase
MSEDVHHQLTIPPEHAGQRLDQVLAELLSEYSRTRIKEWIDAGQVLVNGAKLRPKDKLVGGENVEVNGSLPDNVTVAAEKISLNIVYEDKHVLVINKPAGLVVHPGAGNNAGTLQNALLHFDAKLAQVPRAGIVHRLDKETSGLMVVARTVPAHTALVSAIEAREVEREYEAVCVGVMTGGGVVDAPIDRHPVDRLRMAVRQSGREAVTHYRVVISRRHALPRPHSCAIKTGIGPNASDPRSHAAYPLSDRRRPCVWRAHVAAERRRTGIGRGAERIQTSGAARRALGVSASDHGKADRKRSGGA